jgi:hypothetical protein
MAEPTTPSTTGGEAQPQTAARPARLGLGASVALLAMALLVVGSIGFAAGRLTGPEGAKATSSPQCFGYGYGPGRNTVCLIGGMPGGGMPGGRMPGGMYGYGSIVVGTVQAVDASSVTVAVRGGRTLQIALTNDTKYLVAGSTSPASSADVKVGAAVTIRLANGTSLTASQVIVRNP